MTSRFGATRRGGETGQIRTSPQVVGDRRAELLPSLHESLEPGLDLGNAETVLPRDGPYKNLAPSSVARVLRDTHGLGFNWSVRFSSMSWTWSNPLANSGGFSPARSSSAFSGEKSAI